MKKLSLYVFAFVVVILCVFFLPKIILQFIGCWQIGTWLGGFIFDKLQEDDDDKFNL